MAKKSAVFTSTTLLALGVGLFLLLSGIQTLIDFNSPLAKAANGFGNMMSADQTGHVAAIVIAILKIASGAVLIVGPFGMLTKGIRSLAFWIVLLFWLVLTISSTWNGGVAVKDQHETLMQFLTELSLNIAIFAALWHLKPAKV